MSLYKEYFDTDVETKKIKLTISFNKSTTNWATSRPTNKGYMVTCVPVELKKEIGYTTETFMAFSGFNDLVLKVDRQSSKRLEEAKSIAKANTKQYLEYFKDRYGMIIPKLEELNTNK